MQITVIVETDGGQYCKTARSAPDVADRALAQAVVDLGTRAVWAAAENFGSGSYEVLPRPVGRITTTPMCIDGCDSLDCRRCSPETAGQP